MELPFIKMHGCGNDFVVLDARTASLGLTAATIRAIADRHHGIGCDQLIELLPGPAMRIWNADGTEAGACGNATRCVARLLAAETGARQLVIHTIAGALAIELQSDNQVCVDMGPPRLRWHEIPLAQEADTLHLPLSAGPLRDAAAASMGNPHATFFVDNADAIDLAGLGPALEHAALFADRANIGVATIQAPDRLRLRVWERGAGLTRACGSGACAALVNAHRRGLTGRHAQVIMDGGTLEITWRDDGHVLMTGPAEISFTGSYDFPP